MPFLLTHELQHFRIPVASPSKVKYPSINPLKRGALYASVGAPNSPIGVISALPTIIAITANNIGVSTLPIRPTNFEGFKAK